MKAVKEKRYSALSNILYICRPAMKQRPQYFALWGLEAVLSAVLPLIATAVNARVVAAVSGESSVAALIGSILAVFLGYGAVAAVNTYLNGVNGRTYNIVRLQLHCPELNRKTLTMSLEQYESNSVRQSLEKACDAVYGSTNEGMSGVLIGAKLVFENLLGLALYAAIAGALSPKLLVILLALSAVDAWVASLPGVAYERIKGGLAKAGRMTRYLDQTVDNIAGGKDIRLFSLAPWLIGKYDRAIREQRRLYLSYDAALFLGQAADAVLSAARTLVCYLYLIGRLEGGMAAGEFVFYLGIVSGFAAWFAKISEELAKLRTRCKRIDNFRNYMDIPVDFQDKGIEPDLSTVQVQFDHVSYRYEGAAQDVLKDVSFKLKPGEHLALVGLNGAGKSTLVKLMSGLYLPTSGRVLVNGVDTRQLNRIRYLGAQAAIFQKPFILSYPIGVNIAMSKDYDRARALAAAEQAGLGEKLRTLPKGLDTWLGKDMREEGISLSGGETQKLLLARALYRSPRLILLDEPTAALDAIAENEVYESYSRNLRDVSALFISHRLASTRFCDRILLLESGQIAEEGTHESLLRQGGQYAELFRVQSKYYQEGKKNEE